MTVDPDRDGRTALLVAMADDELFTGHRHSHWTGVAPTLEEDLAFSSIAQDEMNHADVWYQLVVGDDRAAIDAIAFGRSPDGYRNAVICERPPGDFAYTLARHWLYDHADAVRLESLTGSSDTDIAAVATKLRHEERYHLEHADSWFERVLRAGDEQRDRMRDALATAFPEALWLFEPTVHEDEVVATAVLPDPSVELLRRWLDLIAGALGEVGLDGVITGVESSADGWIVDGLFATAGGRRGVHTPDLDEAWDEMTGLYRAHPGAHW